MAVIGRRKSATTRMRGDRHPGIMLYIHQVEANAHARRFATKRMRADDWRTG